MKLIAALESNLKYLFAFLVVFRLINSLLINTFFDPDEYWQSLEVAHKMVFGYGQMTWEWKEMIRSFLHPLIFVLPFKILQALHLDTPTLIIVVPKLVQGFITAIGDLYLYRLTCSIFNKQVARWTLICQLLSWYTFVCLVRTYSNSIETILFIISLYYWPLPEKSKTNNNNIYLSIILTTIAFLIRPTTAIMWLYLVPNYIYHLYQTRSIQSIISLFTKLILTSVFVIIVNVFIDYYFYGKFTFVPFNFLYFNVIKSVSKFYGTHPFHWYFSQGFPTIAFTNIVFFVLGVQHMRNHRSELPKLNLAKMTVISILLYSFLAHKEFRFIFPILPIVMIYSGYYISLFFTQPTDKQIKDNQSSAFKVNSLAKKAIIALLLLNIPMIIFFSNIHQRSPIDIMHYINRNINNEQRVSPQHPVSIHFLMSCHATPYQSYIHNPDIHLKLLECPPPLNENDPIDEKTLFFENPMAWMKDNYRLSFDNQNFEKGSLELPDYFIIRDDLIETLNSLLSQNGYQVEHIFKTFLDHTSSTIFRKIK